jgi:hypothetical protein
MLRGVVVACIVAAVPAQAQPTLSGGAAASSSRTVEVHLNGHPFMQGVAVRSSGDEEILVAVEALQRAIDGPPLASGRKSSAPRLRLEGTKLFAAAAGGCPDCPVRITRAVIVTSRVRVIDGAPWFPLADLVTAFEARLEIDAAKSVYGIYAGTCRWCILEPR